MLIEFLIRKDYKHPSERAACISKSFAGYHHFSQIQNPIMEEFVLPILSGGWGPVGGGALLEAWPSDRIYFV